MKLTFKSQTVKVNLRAFDRRLFIAHAKRELLNTQARIRAGISSGKDPDGGSFRPYSPGYAKKKQDAGRGTTVNLTWTGDMLGAMQVRESATGAEMFFNDGEQARKAAANIGRGRDFFFFGDKDIERIERSMTDLAGKQLDRLLDIT